MEQRDARRPITLLAPGPWADAGPVAAALAGSAAVEWVANDGGFGLAFAYGRYPRAELDRIERCAGAALVTARLERGQEAAGLLALAAGLRDAGAYGVRVEESKAAWGLDEWIAELTAGTPYAALRAVLVMAAGADGTYTSGAHVFGQPDGQMAGDPAAASRFLWMLAVYQVLEDPVLVSGHTFAPDADTPRQVIERWPDDRFPPTAPCHNPFGVWRVGAPARAVPGLAAVAIPSFSALLLAAEAKAGRALTRPEVEAVVDGAAVITMEHRDARELELSRGYADLDPERAWAQWALVRGSGSGGEGGTRS